jgi:seryl-tRNA(Sec) selenium transferase
LEHYDAGVSEANFPYGMTSNLGNFDNRASLWFLENCYASGDNTLAARVAASLKKDLQEQMRYYNSLGESLTNEQLAINAQQALQGKGSSLSDRQQAFASDIVSSYQILMEIEQMQQRYQQARSPAGPSL